MVFPVVEPLEKDWIDWRQKLRTVAPYFIPRPTCGIRWVDFVYILVIGIIQYSVLPRMVPRWLVIDILTPWFAVIAVIHPYPVALAMGVLSALIVEGHSMLPAGTYLCINFIILQIVYIVRELISWRKREPWLVLLVSCSVGAALFEYCVDLIRNPNGILDLFYYSTSLGRIAFSAAFAVALQVWALGWATKEPIE
jgi:hypothetical protein